MNGYKAHKIPTEEMIDHNIRIILQELEQYLEDRIGLDMDELKICLYSRKIKSPEKIYNTENTYNFIKGIYFTRGKTRKRKYGKKTKVEKIKHNRCFKNRIITGVDILGISYNHKERGTYKREIKKRIWKQEERNRIEEQRQNQKRIEERKKKNYNPPYEVKMRRLVEDYKGMCEMQDKLKSI